MKNPDGESIRKRRQFLDSERRIEKDLLLAEVEKRWEAEDKEMVQECLEKTGHLFKPTPDRRKNLAGTLLQICHYCGTSIYRDEY